MKYGTDRLLEDLRALGLAVELVMRGEIAFAVIAEYPIELGKFQGRVIGLGIQATADFPRSVHSAIHVKSVPPLYDTSDSIPNVRNITKSILGDEWRYWSKNFNWTSERTARRLISQINSIFLHA